MKTLSFALCFMLALLGSAHAQTQCVVPPNAAATPVFSTAIEASHIIKSSPGCIISGYVTTGAVAGFIMIHNSTTVPGDGALAALPQNCVQAPANTTVSLNWAPQPTEWYSKGIVVVFSSTGCATQTSSSTAYIHALVQ